MRHKALKDHPSHEALPPYGPPETHHHAGQGVPLWCRDHLCTLPCRREGIGGNPFLTLRPNSPMWARHERVRNRAEVNLLSTWTMKLRAYSRRSRSSRTRGCGRLLLSDMGRDEDLFAEHVHDLEGDGRLALGGG